MTARAERGLSTQEIMLAALRTPLGAVIARPWFDRLALKVLADWFFPLSRLWAAAGAADGSVDRYFSEVPLAPDAGLARRLEPRLARVAHARRDVVDSESRWEEAFFGPGEARPDRLAAIERERLARNNSHNLLRRSFMSLRLADRISPIRWNVPKPDTVAEIYRPLADDLARAFVAPDPMPEVAVSRPVAGDGCTDYWLRFQSPSPRMADQVVARVHEPAGVADPPTLIFGHGICVEFDQWRGLVDEVAELVAMGVRVVRPEAPWHGRRVPTGQYGGERFMATAPLGALDLFTAAVREWAVLLDWCRATTRGPVCIGGSSLGAMTAQLLATRAHDWPAHLRPDAMLLITHCGHIHDAVTEGALARIWGIEQATVAQGWTDDLIARYLPLIDPTGRPVVAPENIVTVLGSQDDVTPFHSGKDLIEDWRIPKANTFISRNGHFSIPLAMMRNHAPIRRFRAILDRLS